MQGLYTMRDGSLRVVISRSSVNEKTGSYSSNITLDVVDKNTGTISAGVDFPYSYNITPGDDTYDFYSYDGIGVYGVNVADGSKTMIANILASGIGDINLSNVTAVSPAQFIASGYSLVEDRYTQNIYLLDKVDPATIPDKKLITVAAVSSEYLMLEYIRKYNKTSTEYQINFKDY
jgi:hypothetical protein